MAMPDPDDDLWPIYILVVDDEPLVRLLLADTLRDAGFTVAEAASADEALTYCHAHQNVDLVFTDVQMPGSMNGIELVAALHDLNPFLPVIVTSGGVGREDVPDVPFIAKPYELEKAQALVFATLKISPKDAE